jgi:ATP-binding cassette subfamily B protein
VSGRITVDGTDLRDVDPRAWRRHVAAIFQDFVQYHLSARENVALGAPDSAGTSGQPPVNERALERAARKAGALELIQRLPHGWETILSRQYPDGTDLSGGQWQRVALARALYAVNDLSHGHTSGANVLILDEPTANLDVRAEAALYERFLDITAGLTTIVISHRFSTVRRADRICVIENGKVAEAGTHDELLAASGRYATMFRLQAERFEDGANDRETERV